MGRYWRGRKEKRERMSVCMNEYLMLRGIINDESEIVWVLREILGAYAVSFMVRYLVS